MKMWTDKKRLRLDDMAVEPGLRHGDEASMGGDGVMGFVKGRRETNTASHSLLHLHWPALRDVEKPALLE